MCEYPYILQQKSQMMNDSYPNTISGENQSQISQMGPMGPFVSLTANNSLMQPSSALGGSRLPGIINNSVLRAQSNQSQVKGNNVTSYGAWNKLTKGDLIVRQAGILDENRIVLFKRGKQIGNGYYIVEVSSNNSHLFIAAYDVESPESLLVEIPEQRAKHVLEQFDNDYDMIASSLNIANKRLMLLNPKYA